MTPANNSMTIQLPAQVIFQQSCRLDNGWSDHYGAIQVAAAYAGRSCPPRYYLRGIWQHGCFGPWQNLSAEALCYSAPGAREKPVWVAREDQAALLREKGYTQVRAVGLPILYTPDTPAERIPGSLLVVPTHTLTGDKIPDRSQFEHYADEIKATAGRFQRVVVCIHPNCQKNGMWVREFTERGLEIVYGALTNDANALIRMRRLFEQFEFVTTNGWGSHVAYALAFGAKVSVYGAQPQRTEADYLRDPSWAANPAGLRAMLAVGTQEQEQEFLKPFGQKPENGVADVAKGRALIGAEHKLTPEEMAAGLTQLVDLPGPQALPASGGGLRRILFASHEATRTGAPTFLLHFLRWLRREGGVEFEILLGQGGPLEDEFRKLGIVHVRDDFVRQPGMLARFDLVYSNTCCNTDLIDALGCGQVPVITHVHELDMAYHWLGARKMAALIRQSSHFVACAEAVATRLKNLFGIPANRISVHHEMIDGPAVAANAVAVSADQLRREYGLPKEAFVILSCGTFELRKAPDLFVQLAARFKDRLVAGRPVRFLWVGALKDADMVRGLREDLRKLGMEREVHFISELPSPHALLALSDVFCLTSREDPFPLVMLEAAALGKPVVCFDRAGGATEFCALGGGLAVPYLDVEAMARTCGELLADPTRAGEVGQRAAKVVAERFTIEAIAPALWQELEQQLPRLTRSRPAAPSLANIYRAWKLDEAPQRALVAAQLARSKARQQAATLMSAGRNREAATLLVHAVNTDFATQDMEIMCESLLEIASDLAPLDAKQAAILSDKAALIARNSNLNLERYRPWNPSPSGSANDSARRKSA